MLPNQRFATLWYHFIRSAVTLAAFLLQIYRLFPFAWLRFAYHFSGQWFSSLFFYIYFVIRPIQSQITFDACCIWKHVQWMWVVCGLCACNHIYCHSWIWCQSPGSGRWLDFVLLNIERIQLNNRQCTWTCVHERTRIRIQYIR